MIVYTKVVSVWYQIVRQENATPQLYYHNLDNPTNLIFLDFRVTNSPQIEGVVDVACPIANWI